MTKEETTTILVIDDEPAIRLGLVVSIKRYGYRVIEAVDGSDGLRKAREHSPDLIVSDVMMPPPDGFELKRLLSTDPSLASIPFIFLTARSGTNDRIAGIRDGADDYISKPFVMEELLARIDALLRRVHAERAKGRQQMAEIARQDMDKLRAEILQNFHHELSTPLMNIIMPLEMAVNQKFSEPETQSHFVKMALSNADKLSALVTDIVILSNIDHGNLNHVRQTIDPDDHILKPVNKLLERYKHKELKFSQHIVSQGEIKAPRREFSQSLLHILDNACKFSPQNGRVHLEVLGDPAGGVTLTVTDEGPGISLDQREKVFEKFYQISQGDSREYDGLGVGLTIARAVFRIIGGDVDVVDCAVGCSIRASLPGVREEDIVYA